MISEQQRSLNPSLPNRIHCCHHWIDTGSHSDHNTDSHVQRLPTSTMQTAARMMAILHHKALWEVTKITNHLERERTCQTLEGLSNDANWQLVQYYKEEVLSSHIMCNEYCMWTSLPIFNHADSFDASFVFWFPWQCISISLQLLGEEIHENNYKNTCFKYKLCFPSERKKNPRSFRKWEQNGEKEDWCSDEMEIEWFNHLIATGCLEAAYIWMSVMETSHEEDSESLPFIIQLFSFLTELASLLNIPWLSFPFHCWNQ